MIRIEFNVAPVLERLATARERLGDLTPVYRDVGSYMIKATKDRFQTGTAPDGTRWRQKSPTTLAEYVRRGHGSRPRPLIGASERLSNEVVAYPDAAGVEIGSALIYSGVMQEGSAKGAFGTNRAGRPVPWGDIPARVWLGISADDERTIIEIVDEHLDEATSG